MTQLLASRPLVAIVTPVYNGEKYLTETMECVQSLDYPNLIHVVLDNASADATPEIISRYRNGRVPVMMSRNETTIPLISNHNAAIRMVPAEASYFRLLCADDTMEVDAISRKVDVAERHPDVGIVGCLLSELGTLREENLVKGREVFDGKEIVRRFLRRESTVVSGTHFLIRRSQLRADRPFYDESFPVFADAEANLRICMRSNFGFVDKGLATWRLHEGNACKIYWRKKVAMAEWLMLLGRYGRIVLSEKEYWACRSAWRRHYLRCLLLMRWRDGDKGTFHENMTILRRNNDPAGLLDFADALIDWVFLVLTRRRHPLEWARQTSSA